MAEVDVITRLVTLEVKLEGLHQTIADLWVSISNQERLLNGIEVQNATIIAKMARMDRVEEDFKALHERVHIAEGEKKSILGLASLFLLPFGGFLFWVIEYLLTGKKP